MQGPYVRLACQRHLDDLKHASERGFYWDPKAALRFIGFCGDLLYVVVDNQLVPFIPMEWQQFAGGCLFGWKRTDNGFRRFTLAYIEAGKGGGKTPFAAAVGLYMMVADGELAAEVYAAASNKEQARIAFKDAVDMVEASPVLAARISRTGVNPVWQLNHRATRSIFKPISSSKTKSGPRVHCAIIDELHEHKNNYALEMMRQGTKKRSQPLIFIITNSGFDRKTVCFEYHQEAIRIVEGHTTNDQFFSMVFALDPEDDPLDEVNGEACWPKTNPGLGITLTWEYLRERVSDARAIPGNESMVRRLNFCQWTDAADPWMTRATWSKVEHQLIAMERGAATIPSDFDGALCYAGLDLSFTLDLTALALVFPEEDGRLAAWIEYFTPAETAVEREHRDKTPYTTWIKQGLVHGVPGKSVRKEYVAARLAQVADRFELVQVAYDKYAHKALEAEIAEAGVIVPWFEHPQGFRRGGLLDQLGPDGKRVENPLWMPESVALLELAIIEQKIEVQTSPVTRWQVSSTVIRQDPAGTGNRVFNKNKSLGRIDGIVALAMAVGAARMRLPQKPSIAGFLANPVTSK